MTGSLSGGLLCEAVGVGAMIAASTVLVVIALTCVAANRGLFAVPSATSQK